MAALQFVMMMGLPGVGKSTYVKENYKDYVIVESDAIRKELGITGHEAVDNIKVFDEVHNRIKNSLKEGKNVVMDATNLSRKNRVHALTLAKIAGRRQYLRSTLVFVLDTVENCVLRDSQRTEPVGEKVIDRMYKSFEAPAYYEGWNEIKVIFEPRPEVEEFYKNADMDHFDQHNSHHKFTLGEHMGKTATYVIGKSFQDVNLTTAASFHDIGKVKTQSYINKKGEVTEDAHYYSHMNVGAYDLMMILLTKTTWSQRDVLDICDLVCMHMHPIIVWPASPKKLKEYIRMAGREQTARVLLLSEADRAACGIEIDDRKYILHIAEEGI